MYKIVIQYAFNVVNKFIAKICVVTMHEILLIIYYKGNLIIIFDFKIINEKAETNNRIITRTMFFTLKNYLTHYL